VHIYVLDNNKRLYNTLSRFIFGHIYIVAKPLIPLVFWAMITGTCFCKKYTCTVYIFYRNKCLWLWWQIWHWL